MDGARVLMERCVALLRGINVGGVKLTNAQLVSAFELQGFANVRAVLASGNVVFDVDREGDKHDSMLALSRRMEAALSQAFAYDAHLVIETQARLGKIVNAYPFARDDALQHPYVIFSSSQNALTKLHDAWDNVPSDLDSVETGDGVIYWRVPKGSSVDSPFAKLVAKREYASQLTTRNLRTLTKLVNA